MPRSPQTIAEEIHRLLDIPLEEAGLYVKALVEGSLSPADDAANAVAKSLSARGMLIVDATGRSYLAVHPRMALSNLFRVYEERIMRQRKEKRLLVDKLTLELIPLLQSESKRTNPTVPRGERTASHG